MTVQDDLGNRLTFDHPIKRIITLAPHLTEMVAAAGAEQYLVGVSSYSDFPPTVKKLPQVNTAIELNLELIVLLKPDLVIAWDGGNSVKQLVKLHELKIPIFYSHLKKLSDIPNTIIKIGTLTQTTQIATKNAAEFKSKWQQLAKEYARKSPVTVFYQLTTQPLLTLNKQSLINEVIELCGGKNVYADTYGIVPEVTDESVINSNPDVIIAMHEHDLQHWLSFHTLRAVQYKHLYVMNPDLLERYGPRIIDGAQMLCRNISQVRDDKPKNY